MFPFVMHDSFLSIRRYECSGIRSDHAMEGW